MIVWNHSKIIATVGPASESKKELLLMLRAGADVFRINGAHGDFDQYNRIIDRVREVGKKEKFPPAIMIDLPGPKYRLGKIKNDSMMLHKGRQIILSCKHTKQIDDTIPVPCALHKMLKKNDKVYINDGLVCLIVRSVKSTHVECEVACAGEIRSGKGINLPNLSVDVPAMTPRDKEILDFAVESEVEYVCMSFVRHAKDLQILKNLIKRKTPYLKLIAKIEKPEALEEIDNIIDVADAVMVARGDLGIEIPFARLPIVQKEILKRCMIAGKPSIVATQMLESMVNSKRPTRAEATDVAEAVWGGADALMLSEETTIGIDPANAVAAMVSIAYEAEGEMPPPQQMRRELDQNNLQAQVLAEAAVLIAEELGACAIVAPTRSGRTPLFVSRQRPCVPILAPTSNEHVARSMNLCWGVIPMMMKEVETVDELLSQAEKAALHSGFIKKGDRIVIASGAHGAKDDVTKLVEVRVV
ncbi:MAG: pyruvate kinase [Deltaproteobacteria bacterium CG07_land_8_20_14_0_80_38_7]|nr:MAG: pyruvate kinase [Deltaproteobacteria bacterium CG07_land_8_20_14_0_80_38_7]